MKNNKLFKNKIDSNLKEKKNNKSGIFLIAKIINTLSDAVHQLLETILSSFRFSIGFRISLIYVKLLISSIVFTVILYIIGLCSFYFPTVNKEDDIINNIIIKNIGDNSLKESYLKELSSIKSIELVIYKNNKIQFSTVNNEEILKYPMFFYNKYNRILYYTKDKSYKLKDNYNYKIKTIHTLDKELIVLANIIFFVICIDLIRIFFIIRRGKKLNKQVLKPISDMTDIAKTISAQNLSERINVAGTKNELKDLAKTINSMMDRIETSYNSQKQFVSDASHELRTPISVIQGYANLVSRWGKEDRDILEESIEAIKNESKNMQDLVEKLLFLARHDKKTLKLEKEYFDLLPMLQDMIKETKMIAEEYDIVEQLAENTIVYGDKQSIKQAIRIFIDNAIKYTPEGGKITIGSKIEEKMSIIYITDNGIGISKENLSKIFDRFYRADVSRTNEVKGHGLGLSIAKLIVLSHDGKIKVKSKIGEGSTFYICLKYQEKAL